MEHIHHTKVTLGSIVSRMTMVVEIEGTRLWPWRLRIAMWLIRLAARVIGCGIRINL